MSDCKQCDKLNRELSEAKRKIERMQKTIDRVTELNRDFLNECNEITSTHQPRGRWSYAKGQGRAATDTLHTLGEFAIKPTVKPRFFKMGLFKTGLFGR